MNASIAALVSILALRAEKMPELRPVQLPKFVEPTFCVDIQHRPFPRISPLYFCGCSGAMTIYVPDAPISVLDIFGDKSGFESVLASETAEIRPLRRTISDHTISFVEDTALELDKRGVTELKRILTSDASYVWSLDSSSFYIDDDSIAGGDFRIVIGKGKNACCLDLWLEGGSICWRDNAGWAMSVDLTSEAYGRVLGILVDRFYFDPYVTQHYAEWLTRH